MPLDRGLPGFLREIEKTGIPAEGGPVQNMAYSKAWKILRESEKAWGFPLTDRETGGKDGGGSTLTQEAVKLVAAYDSFQSEARGALDWPVPKIFCTRMDRGVKEEQRVKQEEIVFCKGGGCTAKLGPGALHGCWISFQR